MSISSPVVLTKYPVDQNVLLVVRIGLLAYLLWSLIADLPLRGQIILHTATDGGILSWK